MEAADPIDYKLEKFGSMGFDHMQCLILANTRDHHGVPLYWCDVLALVERVGLTMAYAILV